MNADTHIDSAGSHPVVAPLSGPRARLARTLWLVWVLGVLGGLLAVELTVRAIVPGANRDDTFQLCHAPSWCGFSRNVIQPHPILGSDNKPNAMEFVPLAGHPNGGFWFHTNGLGLRRDEEVAVPKPAGLFRVLVIGDSQTMGYVNNDEHFPSQVERRLRARPTGQAIEVLNGGVGAYEVGHYPFWYRVHGEELQPDVVLLGLNLGSDIATLAPPTNATEGPDGQLHLDRAGELRYSLGLTRAQLQHYSKLLASLDNGTLAEFVKSIIRKPPSPMKALLEECYGCYFQYLGQGAWAPERVEQTRVELASLLSDMNRRIIDRGGRLVVVPLPAKHMVEPQDKADAVDRFARALGLSPADVQSIERTHEVALAAAADVGVPVLDPGPVLRAAAQSERMYYERSWHLTPSGNRVVGDFLADALVAQHLVPD